MTRVWFPADGPRFLHFSDVLKVAARLLIERAAEGVTHRSRVVYYCDAGAKLFGTEEVGTQFRFNATRIGVKFIKFEYLRLEIPWNKLETALMKCWSIVDFSVCNWLLCLKGRMRTVPDFALFHRLRLEVESTRHRLSLFTSIFVWHTVNGFIHAPCSVGFHVGRNGGSGPGRTQVNRILVIDRHSRLLVCLGGEESILGLQNNFSRKGYLRKPQ